MKNKKFKLLLLAACFGSFLTVQGIYAYFTSQDSASNTFTIGKISQTLLEPSWNAENGKNLTPNKEIQKDPQVKNDGINPQFVFMSVSVPYANVTTANSDGTLNPAADTALFSYSVNPGWTQMGEAEKDTHSKTLTYRYVYGDSSQCTALAKDQKTPSLFDSVTFANVVEGQGLETTTQEIVVKSYGIQTTDIDGGKTDPTGVWSVISKN